LNGAKFNCESIRGVLFTGANLTSADFSNSAIFDCDFSGADLSRAAWNPEQLHKNHYDDKTRFPKGYVPNQKQMLLKK
jgi:uncharacterized protein YjbI with pentapeptide repeats